MGRLELQFNGIPLLLGYIPVNREPRWGLLNGQLLMADVNTTDSRAKSFKRGVCTGSFRRRTNLNHLTKYLIEFSFFQVSFTHQSFQEVIVGIIQRYINLRTVRNTAHRVHQDEVAVGTHLGTVGRRSEAFHNPVGGFLVSLIRQISTQLVKGGRRGSFGILGASKSQ